MSEFDLAALNRVVGKSKTKRAEEVKRKYQLARSLGFDSYEATILQTKKEKTILALGEERSRDVGVK